MANTAERVAGGCFCGAVRYELEPDYIAYRYCFCSRCRKMRGTSNAANIFVKAEKLHWISGEDAISRFDLEGARFGNCFCTTCGSPVARLAGDGKSYLVPSGSFDADPGIRPSSAIFWDSRAEWLPIADTLEKKAEY
jgi:hypothetical protein